MLEQPIRVLQIIGIVCGGGVEAVISHIGRFAYQKNHAFLFRVFEDVAKKRKDALFGTHWGRRIAATYKGVCSVSRFGGLCSIPRIA